MTNDIVRDQIRKFIMEHFPLARKFGSSTDVQLLGNGIIDSLGILELVAYLEAEFEIRLCDEELIPENFHSIEHIVGFVEKKRLAKAGRLP